MTKVQQHNQIIKTVVINGILGFDIFFHRSPQELVQWGPLYVVHYIMLYVQYVVFCKFFEQVIVVLKFISKLGS